MEKLGEKGKTAIPRPTNRRGREAYRKVQEDKLRKALEENRKNVENSSTGERR